MREKTDENGAGRAEETRACARGEELIAYLYGESAPEEAADFRRHLAACADCEEEFAALGGVREGLGAWREEALRTVPPLGVREAVASAMKADIRVEADAVEAETKRARAVVSAARRRSASAALREFFSLSPAWLRVGAAAAVVAFCALAALTLARAQVRWDSNGFALTAGPSGRVAERAVEPQSPAPAARGFTQEQVDALVRQRVEREVAEARARWEAENAGGDGPGSVAVINANGARRSSPAGERRGNAAASGQKAARRTPRGAARGVQLADNGDDFYAGEESVPRLIDILGAVKSPGKANER
jgi:hypothetical protein